MLAENESGVSGLKDPSWIGDMRDFQSFWRNATHVLNDSNLESCVRAVMERPQELQDAKGSQGLPRPVQPRAPRRPMPWQETKPWPLS